MKPVVLLFLLLVIVGLALGLKDPICGLQPAKEGFCLANKPSFTYYPDRNECSKFVYGGCNGNENRFSNKELCENKCKE
nr:kunitz-type serine protease inhibitor-like [Drosophila bipectinata]